MCLKNILVYNHIFSFSSFLSLGKVQLCSRQIGLQIKWIIFSENSDCLMSMVSKCYVITMPFIRALMRWPRQVQFESLLYERNSASWLWKVSANHLRKLKLPPERNIASQCCKQQISGENTMFYCCIKVLDIWETWEICCRCHAYSFEKLLILMFCEARDKL